MQAGGVLDLLVAECLRSAVRPQPFLALGAAVCAVGALAGRRYRTGGDLRSNLYALALATHDTGAGLHHAPEVVRRVLAAAGLGRYLAVDGLAGGPALLAALSAQPSLLLLAEDGPGRWLDQAALWPELVRWHGRAASFQAGTVGRRGEGWAVVQQPCLCLYATAGIEMLRDAVSRFGLTGFARCLVFLAEQDRPPRNRMAEAVAPPERLLAGLRAIAGPGAGQGGAVPDPLIVPMTPAATALLNDKLDAEERWAERVAGQPDSAVVDELADQAGRLMLIRAVARNPVAPEIGVEDVAWGWALAEHSARSLLRLARGVEPEGLDARQARLLRIIRGAGAAGLTRTALYRRTHFLGGARDALLQGLIESGAVRVDRAPGRTKPTLRYFAAVEHFTN